MTAAVPDSHLVPSPKPSASRRWRLAAVIERPIPFYVPHYRSLADDPDIELTVIYLSDAGLKPFTYHQVQIAYTEEILKGYHSIILGRQHPQGYPASLAERALPEIWRVLSHGGYHAVWVHGYNLPGHWLAFMACRAQDIPIILRGESELMFDRAWWRRSLKRMAFGWLFPRVSAFLYIGSLNRDFYRHYGVPERKLYPMLYGIDNRRVQGADEAERLSWRRQVRERLGIPETSIVFINHSKHRLPKRPADVVRAFALLDPRTDTVLILVGDGDQRTQVDAACSELQPGHRVIRLGFQPYEELPKLLAAADVLAFASEENWGMAVNEGLAAGLAILCSDKVAGCLDMVDDGENGYIFESRNQADLADKMNRLLSNPSLLDTMRRASRLKSMNFGFEAMNQGLLKAIQECTNT